MESKLDYFDRDDQADARRYRHLRNLPAEVPQKGLDVAFWENEEGDSVRGDALDAMVDAEIAAAKPAGALTPEEDDEAAAMNDIRPD